LAVQVDGLLEVGCDLDGAIEDCSTALSVQPNYPLARFNRGRAYFGKGDRAAAEKDLAEVLKSVPPDWPYRAEAEQILREIRK
jgi:tetratricopeptide (TPR) repeat protein